MLVLAGWALVAGCSSERKGPIARTYHNLAARDNAYFMGREKLKDVERALLKSMVSDYNKTLPVFPPLTEATVTAVNADLEDIVKKASLPIARHKNSNWTDDSYLLIGKVRYYKMEFEEAEKVFKYVNTTGKEPNVRHAALVWLMRTFLVEKQIDNAVAVSDLLDKERGHPENARDLFLTRAQLAIVRNEPEKAIVNLRLAIPEVDGKNERSRLRFILGQLYQQLGQDKLANEQYRKVLRRNPPYELDLFTKLNLSQVTELSDASGKARIDKYLARLIKDPKNEEYRDKIYYEMARLEYRQQHYKKALEDLTLSVRSSKSAQSTQKPYSYLFAGQIYYDKLRNYRLAARYYDSAVQVMPVTAAEYPATLERKDILADFAKHLDIVERQDSLQELAHLDTTELNRRLTAMINAELNRREEAAKKAAKLAAIAERSGPAPVGPNDGAFPGRSPGTPPGGGLADPTAPATGGIWYFDNPATLGTARTDFQKRWGNRTLQDNWRLTSLSQRTTQGGPSSDKTGGLPGSPGSPGVAGDSATAKGGSEQTAEQVRAAAAAAMRADLLKDLPKTAADFKASDALIEEALYQLARIYDERLHEPEMAIERYEELLQRFPNTAHGPEALYALYLLAQRAKDTAGMQKYGSQLRQKYPKTEYAQLIDDPDFLHKQKLLNAKVHVLYDSAFALYRDGLYPKSAKVVAEARRQYPVNDISDKLTLLDALIVGHTGKPATYKAALQQIPLDYPASPLLPQVADLLRKIDEFESGKLNASEATASIDTSGTTPARPSHPPTAYSATKAVPHAVMVVYPRDAGSFRGMDVKLSNFNRTNFSSDNLNVSPLLFGDDKNLLVIKDFEDSRAAMNYAKRHRTSASPLAKVTDVAYQIVVISLDNLPAFYQARDLEEYQAFYRDNYEE